CQIHRTFALDGQGRRSCGVGAVRSEVFEVWPSDLARLFTAAGLPRRPVPPPAPGCPGDGDDGHPPRISSPLSGVTYTVRPGTSEEAIALQAAVDGDAAELYWFVDESFVGRAKSGATLFWRPRAGHFTVRAVDDRGRSDARPLKVEVLR
ncbi:MAG TPA: penicillin-binding protein 1C, partial [Polyangia bacterium]|nr:penicillin-binding protein 1C [Polyangia bacterium]